jgi:hypothetical protein
VNQKSQNYQDRHHCQDRRDRGDHKLFGFCY